MRSDAAEFDLVRCAKLPEALELLDREPGVWRPFAGGTDLMVLFEAGKLAHRKYVSIWELDELRGIEESPAHVTLGALTTYSDVLASPLLAREFPNLGRAAELTGAVAIQNRGTLGGNIANASPAADSAPALLAYEAELELVSARGARTLPYRDFHTGYKRSRLEPNELLARIRLPRRAKGGVHFFRKVGTRMAQAISKVVLAGFARVTDGRIGEVRVALGSVAPIPLRAERTEAALRGRAPDAAAIAAARAALDSEIAPIDDIRSSARFRRRVAGNLLEEFIGAIGRAS